MCKRMRDRMWPRLNKKNIVNGIKILTYWSIVSGIIYVHAINNAVTQRNIYGTDNPQTSEITNYQPIDAELGLTIKPLVSGDGQVTLDIFVVQSSFGTRIDENAPPDISSREFSSIIRVKDQDIIVLGGLEEQMRNNSGSGVPLLARIPLIKWLFSKRKREARKAKLTVLIKPTIIY